MMGKLIVVEGCDGAGKETQVKLLIQNLENKGLKVGTLAFPRYSETAGGKILAYALGKLPEIKPDFSFSKLAPEAASLPYAMDRFESKGEIEKMLSENDVVILDRYYTANLLHQGAKFESEIERNDFIEKITKIELEILGIPKPDKIFYLQIPFEISLRRINERSNTGVQIKDLVEADEEYVKRSNEKGEAIASFCGWEIVNGVEENGENVRELSREEIAKTILEKVENRLGITNENKEFKFLK